MEGVSQNGIQGTQDQQASVLVINLGTNTQQPIVSQQPMQFQSNTGSGNTYLNGNPQPFNVYESIAPQQPVQFQNIAGQGQMSFNTNPPPYYGENLYPHQSYLQDPYKATFPMQPNPTDNIPPPYGGNYYSTPQQPGMAIQQQPTTVPVSTAVQTPSGDNYLTLSALMTCLVLITGGWPSLLCTTAALCISYNARDDEKRGNIAAARTKANISLCLNITAVVLVTVMWSVVAIPVAVTVSAQTSAAQLPAISTPSTVPPTTSTTRPTTSTTRPTTNTPTPYCYSTQNPSYCYSSYCYSYYYYSYLYYYTYYYSSCLYSAYYSYYSYSYYYYSNPYYYSQYCSTSYSLTCSPNG